MKKCKVCKTPTDTVFNINLNAVSICEDCAKAIFIQQAIWYSKLNIEKIKDDTRSK